MSDEMRTARDRLLEQADKFSTASADNLAALEQAARNLPGESGEVLRAWVERLPEQTRLHLASVRDLAHHLPVNDPTGQPDDTTA